VPETDEVYPSGREATRVVVPGVSEPLEGEHRVGHFSGVATVVTKLFNMVEPHIAVFGEKDYQQLLVVRRLVQDLDLPIEIEGVPTVRDPDGLALSSRNRYLSPEERHRAPALYRVLSEVAAAVAEQPEAAARLEAEARIDLGRAGLRPDYLAVRDACDLGPPDRLGRPLRVLAAAWLGRARLIDNVPVVAPAQR
jgi:pantoate--beta-alanine ligase